MKVAVLGANGQLGCDVAAAFRAREHQVVEFTHADVEVASLESAREALGAVEPDIVVNTAAFHNVEKCEADPERAYAVNALGAQNLAQVTRSMGSTLMHLSTDYVFDGKKQSPYLEHDPALPANIYGMSKLAGENFARAFNPRHFVVRVSAIYGANPCRAKGGLNFVELMLKLSREREFIRVVTDEFITPTPTMQIAEQLVVLSRTTEYGLYHATAEGSCSWYEFARAIFDISGARVRLDRAEPGEFPSKVPRPKFSVLENAALKEKSLNIFTHWKIGLENYIARREHASVVSAR